MKKIQVLKNMFTDDPGQPRYLKGTNGIGVLLLHGFTGFPDRLGFLGRQLNTQGYTVHIPRLPGHGVCGSDFASASHHDWLRTAVDSWYNIRGECKQVFVGGLSMGGLLSVILASQGDPAGVMLYAPALAVSNRLIYLTPILQWFVKKAPLELNEKVDDPKVQFLLDDIGSYRWPPQIASLLKLQKAALKALKHVQCPVFLVLSKNDTTVPLKVQGIVESKLVSPDLRLLILENSSHVVTNSTDKDAVAGATIQWLDDQLHPASVS